MSRNNSKVNLSRDMHSSSLHGKFDEQDLKLLKEIRPVTGMVLIKLFINVSCRISI